MGRTARGEFLLRVRTFRSGIASATLLFTINFPADAFQLITAEDASRKPGPILEDRGNIPGPIINIAKPVDGGRLGSPVTFEVSFKPFAGSKIDVNTIRIIYVKDPWVDLTARIRNRLAPAGFEPAGFKFDDGDVVPGTHTIRIEVRDTDGRSRAAHTTFTIGR